MAGNQGKHLRLPNLGSFRAGVWRGRLRMLAGCASGLFSNLETVISQQIRYEGEIYPNPAWTERYRKMQLLFDGLYESSEQFWDQFES